MKKPPASRAPKMGAELLASLVGRLRAAFYPETLGVPSIRQRPFFQDLRMLRMAATYPAAFIRENGTGEFDAVRYEEIFAALVRDVKLNARFSPEQMRRRGAYILKCVQDHWRHNWERYAPESKSAAAAVQREVRAMQHGVTPEAGPRALAVLAAVHDALKAPRAKQPAKPVAPKPRETQAELF